jgi:hypothetical protein
MDAVFTIWAIANLVTAALCALPIRDLPLAKSMGKMALLQVVDEMCLISMLINSLLVCSALAIMLGWIASRYPGNHWGGFDIRWMYLILLPLGVATGLARWRRHHRKLSTAVLAICIAASLIILFLDSFNLLVQYDLWLMRGGPGPFEPSRYAQ